MVETHLRPAKHFCYYVSSLKQFHIMHMELAREKWNEYIKNNNGNTLTALIRQHLSATHVFASCNDTKGKLSHWVLMLDFLHWSFLIKIIRSDLYQVIRISLARQALCLIYCQYVTNYIVHRNNIHWSQFLKYLTVMVRECQWHCKSPVTWLFFQQLAQSNNSKTNAKALHTYMGICEWNPLMTGGF